MSTQTENLTEFVSLAGRQIPVDPNFGKSPFERTVDRILEEDGDKSKDDKGKPMPKPDDNDTAARGEAEKIINDYTDWLLTIAVSLAHVNERRRKMAELLREFVPKIMPHAKHFAGDPSKPVTKVTSEAEARRMFAAVGLSDVGDTTVAHVAAQIREGKISEAKATVADWQKVAQKCNRTAALHEVNTTADALEYLRS